VEIVRRVYEVWNAGNLDALREMYDPDVIVRGVEDWPEPGPYVGREAVMRQWKQVRETWDADAFTPTSDFIDVGDRVAVRQIWRGTGRGPQVDVEQTHVFTVHKGRIIALDLFWDHGDALETMGLSEQETSQAISNVELVRSIYAGWERGDFSSAEWAHPEIEFVFADGPTPGRWTGRAKMAEVWGDALSVFEALRAEAEAYRELDDERVLVPTRNSGRGKTSALELGQMRWRGANLFHVRGGKVTRLVLYWDRERALADLDLPSEVGPQPS
jgi:ketosteroid isomerase-like protein